MRVVRSRSRFLFSLLAQLAVQQRVVHARTQVQFDNGTAVGRRRRPSQSVRRSIRQGAYGQHDNVCTGTYSSVFVIILLAPSLAIALLQILSAAYFFSGKETYGERAALLLRTWFLDPATWMHPNLNFSSLRMGHNNGSPSGVIDIQ